MMRLINCKSLDSLRLEYFEPCNVPKLYAILSHTWEKLQGSDETSEVLFDDFQGDSQRRTEANETGWRKIEGVCREVKKFNRHIDYVWVDSCCINKKDAAELSESINSMFKWYAKSTVCFVYLSDGRSNRLEPTSKWFTRGWTLQELVASPNVRFHNHDWRFIGDKSKLSHELAKITGIDRKILEATDEQSISRALYGIPVCQKMSWASMRQTTKVEDTAYCLLGIFDIHMPLLYGERDSAFQRLQEAIANKYNDLTILAWKCRDTKPESHSSKHVMYYSRTRGLVGSMQNPGNRECYHGVFACSPREFKHSGSISSCFIHPSIFNCEYSITSKGLKMVSTLRKGDHYGSYIMPLMCRASTSARDSPQRPGAKGKSLGIFLKWVGGTTYVRANCTELGSMDPRDLEQGPGQDEFYLAPSVEQLHHSVHDLQRDSIILPHSTELSIPETDLSIRSTKVSPGFMWDDKERMFHTYGHQNPVGCASYELSGGSGILFIACFGLHYNGVPWLCLAGPDSSLWPSPVERRPDFLKRAALVAKQSSTTRLVIDMEDYLEDASQKWLIVEGSLSISSSQHVHAHRVNFSFGLESGLAQTITDMVPYGDAAIYESDGSIIDDWTVVETPSSEESASPSMLDDPAMMLQLPTRSEKGLSRMRYLKL